jgi:hypothetical protein
MGVTRLTGQNLDNLALVTTVKTSETSVTATSSATGDTCMTLGPFSVNGGNYFVVLYAPYLTLGTTNLDVELWVDGAFSQTLSGHMAAGVTRPGTVMVARVNLGEGNHTLLVKAFVDAGTGKYGANNGATGNAPNALGFVIPA